jgi:hypothetical protein
VGDAAELDIEPVPRPLDYGRRGGLTNGAAGVGAGATDRALDLVDPGMRASALVAIGALPWVISWKR